jgi:SAM-dependent methyltransferase
MAKEQSMNADERAGHWNSIYKSKETTEVSWYQRTPGVSLARIESLALGRDAAIIDVGGGASTLAGALLDRGFSDISVLDVSLRALELAQERLGSTAQRVHWLREDVLSWRPRRTYALWHDRAVFHLLIDPASRQRYVEVLRASLAPDGQLVVGTFALDGADQCSGLPVARYDAARLNTALGDAFLLLDERREEHHTPSGVVQPFTWATFQRRPE